MIKGRRLGLQRYQERGSRLNFLLANSTENLPYAKLVRHNRALVIANDSGDNTSQARKDVSNYII